MCVTQCSSSFTCNCLRELYAYRGHKRFLGCLLAIWTRLTSFLNTNQESSARHAKKRKKREHNHKDYTNKKPFCACATGLRHDIFVALPVTRTRLSGCRGQQEAILLRLRSKAGA